MLMSGRYNNIFKLKIVIFYLSVGLLWLNYVAATEGVPAPRSLNIQNSDGSYEKYGPYNGEDVESGGGNSEGGYDPADADTSGLSSGQKSETGPPNVSSAEKSMENIAFDESVTEDKDGLTIASDKLVKLEDSIETLTAAYEESKRNTENELALLEKKLSEVLEEEEEANATILHDKEEISKTEKVRQQAEANVIILGDNVKVLKNSYTEINEILGPKLREIEELRKKQNWVENTLAQEQRKLASQKLTLAHSENTIENMRVERSNQAIRKTQLDHNKSQDQEQIAALKSAIKEQEQEYKRATEEIREKELEILKEKSAFKKKKCPHQVRLIQPTESDEIPMKEEPSRVVNIREPLEEIELVTETCPNICQCKAVV